MNGNLPALRPVCPTNAEHGFMTYRPGRTSEQRWCGIWYDCTDFGCNSSVLLHSRELAESLDRQRAGLAP